KAPCATRARRGPDQALRPRCQQAEYTTSRRSRSAASSRNPKSTTTGSWSSWIGQEAPSEHERLKPHDGEVHEDHERADRHDAQTEDQHEIAHDVVRGRIPAEHTPQFQ